MWSTSELAAGPRYDPYIDEEGNEIILPDAVSIHMLYEKRITNDKLRLDFDNIMDILRRHNAEDLFHFYTEELLDQAIAGLNLPSTSLGLDKCNYSDALRILYKIVSRGIRMCIEATRLDKYGGLDYDLRECSTYLEHVTKKLDDETCAIHDEYRNDRIHYLALFRRLTEYVSAWHSSSNRIEDYSSDLHWLTERSAAAHKQAFIDVKTYNRNYSKDMAALQGCFNAMMHTVTRISEEQTLSQPMLCIVMHVINLQMQMKYSLEKFIDREAAAIDHMSAEGLAIAREASESLRKHQFVPYEMYVPDALPTELAETVRQCYVLLD